HRNAARRREGVARIVFGLVDAVEQADGEDMRAVDQQQVGLVRSDLERKEAGFRVQQIADAFRADVLGARAGEEKCATHRLSSAKRDLRLGSPLLDAEL